MSIILRKAEKTTTLTDLQDRLQQMEDAGDLLVSLSTKPVDGTDFDVAALDEGAARPPLGVLELFTEPVGMTEDREASFFKSLQADGSSLVDVANIFIEGELARVIVCRRPVAVDHDAGKRALELSDAIDQITKIAADSDIARFNWKNRGVASSGYIKGMAVAYARVYCKLKAGDAAATEMAKANTGNKATDALAWYSALFSATGMDNDTAGADTLRHLFVLLIGLGMRESSGRYCEGRDTTASNTTAETAEAGLFQTSFNARTSSPLLPVLFAQYSANPSGFVEIFRENIDPPCSSSDFENFGSGDGAEFQRLSKACPAFAVEFAAVGLRNIRAHWGPITRREAQIRPECDAMLKQAQDAVDASNLCPI